MIGHYKNNEYIQKRFTRWQFDMNVAVHVRLFGIPDSKTGYTVLELPETVNLDRGVHVSSVRIKTENWENDIRQALTNGFNPSLQYYNPFTLSWYQTASLTSEQSKLILRMLSNIPVKYINSK